MELAEIGLGSVKWIGLAQDRDKWKALVNVVMNFRVSCYLAMGLHVAILES
jgi:hypothetical protein